VLKIENKVVLFTEQRKTAQFLENKERGII